MNIEQYINDIFSIVNELESLPGRLEAMQSDFLDLLLPIVATMAAFLLGLTVLGILVRLAVYVVRSFSMYIIADRRWLDHCWLAWIPVGRDWLLGALSDDYRHRMDGKRQYRGRILLGLSIASVVLGILGTFPLLMMIGLELGGGFVFTEMLFAVIAIDVVAGVLGLAVGIARLVFHHMSIYDVYRSCMPKYSVLFLVLGIFLGFLEPFFLMACRNKDDGLRKEKPKAEEKPAPEQKPQAEQAKPQPAPELKPEPQPAKKEEPAPAEEKQAEIPAAPEKKEPELPPVIHLPAAGGMDDAAGNQ